MIAIPLDKKNILLYFVHTNIIATCPQIEVGQDKNANKQDITSTFTLLMRRATTMDFDFLQTFLNGNPTSGCVPVETSDWELRNSNF